jgi:hypothetical protein
VEYWHKASGILSGIGTTTHLTLDDNDYTYDSKISYVREFTVTQQLNRIIALTWFIIESITFT